MFLEGFVTAQDRMWQMDNLRRFAAGELAEIYGPKLIEQDPRISADVDAANRGIVPARCELHRTGHTD